MKQRPLSRKKSLVHPFSLLLLGAICLCAVARPVQAQSTTPTVNQNPPTFGGPGPYMVGKSMFVIDKGADNALQLVMWYPALKQSGNQTVAPLSVPSDYQVPDVTALEGRVWGPAAPWAMPDTSAVPYPLVIFSPGYGGSAKYYLKIEQHLASFGLVVIAPAANTDNLRSTDYIDYIARPRLITREIDFAVAMNSRDGSFKGLIDTKHKL